MILHLIAVMWDMVAHHWIIVGIVCGCLFSAGKIYLDGGIGR